MKKQYDDFQKMSVNEMAETISEMTYAYVDPKTKLPTEVPSKHYKEILNATVEQFVEEQVQQQIFATIYSQIDNLKKEYGKDFIKTLICMDMGINPKKMKISEKLSLEITYAYFIEKEEKEKKKFHFLADDIVEKFEECMNDKELQGQIINPFLNEDEDDEDNVKSNVIQLN